MRSLFNRFSKDGGRRSEEAPLSGLAEPTSLDAGDSPTTIKNEALIKVLQECCKRSTPAMIISPDVGVVCRARFVAYSENSVTFELFANWAATIFMPLSLCCVTFNGPGRANVFLGSVHDYHALGERGPLPRLVLALPKQLVTAEARRTLRIPITDAYDVRVQLTNAENRVWTPKARDISMIGMLVEFEPTDDPKVSIGAEFKLEVRVENGEPVRLNVAVRRAVNGSYGLFFQDVMKKGNIDPSEPLKNLIALIERKWIATLPKEGVQAGGSDVF